ncbi:hypothetical protein ABH942_002903 [Flavobacterium sp. 28YEA47A]|uniref:hypothetical protein n=1 Tax=Flavobacterium sp. 28YEA47A TaxID=3156276 RepID=UPI0035125E4F
MKFCFSILFIFTSIIVGAQARMELTPKGFDPNPIRSNLPFMTNEKFLDGTKLWIQEFSRGEADVSEITENSLTIDAFRDNAFFYRNLGDTYYQKVKYRMKISKEGNEYVLSFQVTEIYAKNTLMKSGITDYFTPDGKMKDGFQEVKSSIEKTVGIILDSYNKYITNYAKT